MPTPLIGETLGDLREEIDRIDAALHSLLMQRGEIIDRLIQVKARQGGGSAFRPAREADMMRRLVERHEGLLPVDTVETIWRIIISTFTYVQSNYAVHADISGGDAIMRDCFRFHFGFTVPYRTHPTAADVIHAITAAKGDLGLVPVTAEPSAGAWWMQLAAPDAPKIIARLPFIERSNHPAGLPLFVVATPLADASARDVIILAARLDRWHETLAERLAHIGLEILDKDVASERPQLMLAVSSGVAHTDIEQALRDGGVTAEIFEIGSHAARFDLAARPI